VSEHRRLKAQVDRAYQSWRGLKSLADSGKELLDGSWSARAEVLEKQIGSRCEDWQIGQGV